MVHETAVTRANDETPQTYIFKACHGRKYSRQYTFHSNDAKDAHDGLDPHDGREAQVTANVF